MYEKENKDARRADCTGYQGSWIDGLSCGTDVRRVGNDTLAIPSRGAIPDIDHRFQIGSGTATGTKTNRRGLE